MKTASLALLVATLPLLAQAETPKPASAGEQKAEATVTPPAAEATVTPPAAEATVTPPAAEAKPTPWWKNRRPRPVADRPAAESTRRHGKGAAAKAPEAPSKEEKAATAKQTPKRAERTVAKAPPAKPAPQAASRSVAPKPTATPAEEAGEAGEKKRGFFGTLGRVLGSNEGHAHVKTRRGGVRRALPANTPENKAESDKKKSTTTAAASSRTIAPAPAPATVASTAARPPEEGASAPRPAKPSSSTPKVDPSEDLALPGDSTLPQAPVAVAPPAPAPQSTPPPPAVEKPQPKAAVEFDRKKYQEVKQQAAQDPKVAELGKKLESAPSGEPHKTAARRYTKALFKKMNELDASQPEWFQKMEAATLRRIDSGKPISAE